MLSGFPLFLLSATGSIWEESDQNTIGEICGLEKEIKFFYFSLFEYPRVCLSLTRVYPFYGLNLDKKGQDIAKIKPICEIVTIIEM